MAEDIWHGFDEGAREAISEYLEENGATVYDLMNLPGQATVILADGTVMKIMEQQPISTDTWEPTLIGQNLRGEEQKFSFFEIHKVRENNGIDLKMPENHYIDQYYVIEDLAAKGGMKIERYKDLGAALESLLLDNIITQEEYDNLKHFTLINECKKCIHMLSDNNMLDKDKYYTSVHLNHCMLLFMNRLARMFKFIEVQIEAENKWIKTHLDDIYYNEVYLFSDEYVEQWAERAEAEAEYYAEHPEAFEDMEESEEDRLFEKINEAIWAGDVETIKKCFPQIDKNDKQIQAELTWIVAKDVMKNRELRELYFQKYGVKYKVRKEKRRNS